MRPKQCIDWVVRGMLDNPRSNAYVEAPGGYHKFESLIAINLVGNFLGNHYDGNVCIPAWQGRHH